MTTLVAPRVELEPLRIALLERATRESEGLVEMAAAEGRASVAAARGQVAQAIEAAREQGRADGAELAAAALTAARRRGRDRVLAERRAGYEQVREAARHTVRSVLEQDGNRGRLASVLTAALGGAVELHDTADGGLVASSSDGRSIDASVASLADRALEQVDLARLWEAP